MVYHNWYRTIFLHSQAGRKTVYTYIKLGGGVGGEITSEEGGLGPPQDFQLVQDEDQNLKVLDWNISSPK
jgi:hypothetical protein